MTFKLNDNVKITQGAGEYTGLTGTITEVLEDGRYLITGEGLSGAAIKMKPIPNSRYVLESMIEKVNE